MPEQVRLIHIAPELPPTVGGVADYTALLSRQLVEVSGGTVEPVLVHAGRQPADAIEVDFPVMDLSGQCSAAALAETVEKWIDKAGGEAIVLLEYSGYGYSRNGAPRWLLDGLRRVCGAGDFPLITMFHELYASGPPWSRSFWRSFGQAHVIRRLARLSESVATNRPDSAEWLRSASNTAVQFAPVFSNMGEPEEPALSSASRNYAVVFGGTGKGPLYADHGKRLGRFLRPLEGVERILDVGPSSEQAHVAIDGLRIEEVGIVDRDTGSSYLRDATVGLLCRNPAAMTKSGSLAAYLAHGVPTVVALRGDEESRSGLIDGTHYLSLDTALSEIEENGSVDWQALGRRGHEWYRENAHSRHTARIFSDLLRSVSSMDI